MKTTSDIRAAFLDFFAANGHALLPSSSLVPHNDPTLMFANAGMNQFKNIFTGAEKSPHSRAATSQKCVRAGGKHNDLDNVGYTARHHTFFEMLGNFSFGDYFKEEAINLAWKLLTKDYGLNPDKLCVTVYHDDDAAWNHWKKISAFPDHRIIRINSNDNFWSMGDTGPCGPCSEIFYDHGEHIAGGPPGSPEQDGDRFVEIWNLVFMQYEQLANGQRINLPKPSIDTGMGLERISAVMQGVHNNYDIDLFRNLIDVIRVESRESRGSNARLESPDSSNVAYKVIADHLRSSCFMIADGILPSNEGRGYVLRRIMRRAMRYAHQLGCKEPLMYRLVPALVAEMGAQYPELGRASAVITENLRSEEERFKETLERGLKLLYESLTPDTKIFSGDTAFKLYDTYGFPLDLTQDILKAKGINVDVAAFEDCMNNQREMARASYKGSGDSATGKIWFALKEKLTANKFLGYEQEECSATILAIVKDGVEITEAGYKDEVAIILDQSVFYGESGGQIGDSGFLSLGDKLAATVKDTQKPLEDLIVHYAIAEQQIKIGDKVNCVINNKNRKKIRANHSATHLLHKALRDLLGDHVTQKGSLVNDEKLRFDFSHNKAVGKEEIAVIENVVNEVVARGGEVSCRIMSPDEAISAGAMALFGEKYGEEVRVLSIGKSPDKNEAVKADSKAYSVELCGGTHVRDVADIGLFKIISEGSVASGIRRIEAVTAENVRNYMLSELEKLQEALTAQIDYGAIKTAPLKDLPEIFADLSYKFTIAIESQNEAARKRAKEEAEARKREAMAAAEENISAEKIGALSFIGKSFSGIDAKELRTIIDKYLTIADIAVVASSIEGKAAIAIGVKKELSGQISAVNLIQKAVAELGGKGGGGRPEMAQGGGPEADKIEQAIKLVKEIIAELG